MATGVRNESGVSVFDVRLDSSKGEGDVEMGDMSATSRLTAPHAVNVVNKNQAKSCCSKACHMLVPKDWSVYPTLASAFTAIGFGVFHSIQDENQWTAAPSFAVGLICMVAAVRINYLGLLNNIDDEAKDFRANNAQLSNRVQELETTTKTLQTENVQLGKEVQEFKGLSHQFEQDNNRLKKELEDLESVGKEITEDREGLQQVNKELQEKVEGLETTVGAFEKTNSELEEHLTGMQQENTRLEDAVRDLQKSLQTEQQLRAKMEEEFTSTGRALQQIQGVAGVIENAIDGEDSDSVNPLDISTASDWQRELAELKQKEEEEAARHAAALKEN